ncbi:MAG: hypothetical protein AB1598_06385 [Thermodesulfobacteriota bacterium]
MSLTEYLAVGFPLVTGAVLAAFFPIRLKDYFVEGEIQKLGHGLTPYKFKPRHYLGIFVIYILSAAFLSVVQAYLLWNAAPDKPGLRLSYRFSDYFLYPVFPSSLMAVLLMLFVFSYLYARRGEDDVRKFLLRTYDGWPLYKEIPRFKPVALAAGILCTAVNLRIYNIYLNVTDNGIVYNSLMRVKPVTIPYDEIWCFEVVEHTGREEGRNPFTLRIKTNDLKNTMTKTFLLNSGNIINDIDKIINTSQEAGGYADVVIIREGMDNSKVVWGSLLDGKNDRRGTLQ